MIRKILLLSFLSINAMAQDQNATRILNELSEKTASCVLPKTSKITEKSNFQSIIQNLMIFFQKYDS